eukprot:COSAG05_NODE_5126_length_1258_cov_1.999137_1_plen_285_part_00
MQLAAAAAAVLMVVASQQPPLPPQQRHSAATNGLPPRPYAGVRPAGGGIGHTVVRARPDGTKNSPPNAALATLRPCDAAADPGQGWHWQGDHLLSNGRNGNESAPNWKLPDCGWCLALGAGGLVGGHAKAASAVHVRRAHCCTRASCLHQPDRMCSNASSTIAMAFTVRADGRLLSASGSCIGAANATAGLAVVALNCSQTGAAFIAWFPHKSPSFRVQAAAASVLCLGTGVAPGTRPRFHCAGERCVPGGNTRVSYLDPGCFAECATNAIAMVEDALLHMRSG